MIHSGKVKIDGKGQFNVSLPKDVVITLSTVETAVKGSYPSPPPSASFPLPYSENFNPTTFSEAFNFADQAGAFEIYHNASSVGAHEWTLRQVSNNLSGAVIFIFGAAAHAFCECSVGLLNKVDPSSDHGDGTGFPMVLLQDFSAATQTWVTLIFLGRRLRYLSNLLITVSTSFYKESRENRSPKFWRTRLRPQEFVPVL